MKEELVKKVSVAEPSNIDWLLRTLVFSINKAADGKGALGITLTTHGFLISGDLIGSRQYFKGLGDEIKEDGNFDELPSVLNEMGTKAHKDYEEMETSENIMFIHLKNAKFYTTSGVPVPDNRGVHWRGRLSEISGFILGTLS